MDEPMSPKNTTVHSETPPVGHMMDNEIGNLHHFEVTLQFASTLHTELKETSDPLEWLEHTADGSWRKITLREIYARNQAHLAESSHDRPRDEIVFPTYDMVEAWVKM